MSKKNNKKEKKERNKTAKKQMDTCPNCGKSEGFKKVKIWQPPGKEITWLICDVCGMKEKEK